MISYWQWRTASDKLKFDLFEKRLKVYESTRELVEKTLTGGATSQDVVAFSNAVKGAEFLFSGETRNFYMQISSFCAKIAIARSMSGNQALTEEQEKLFEFLRSQHGSAHRLEAKFGPYLNLGHIQS